MATMGTSVVVLSATVELSVPPVARPPTTSIATLAVPISPAQRRLLDLKEQRTFLTTLGTLTSRMSFSALVEHISPLVAPARLAILLAISMEACTPAVHEISTQLAHFVAMGLFGWS